MISARSRLFASWLLVLASSCERDPPSEPIAPGAPSIALSAAIAPRPPRAVSSETLGVVSDIRDRALSVAAPPSSFRRLAFGKRFLVQLGNDQVVLRSSEDGEELAKLPIAAHGALSLPFGSVFVAGAAGSYRIDPGSRAPLAVARVSLLPGSELHPSREGPEHLWIVQTTLRNIQRYALATDAGLGLEREQSLVGYDGRAFTTLLDGSFLYTVNEGLARLSGRGEALRFPFADGTERVWRLLAGDRIHRAWLVTSDGELLLVELAGRARVVRRIRTGLRPFDVAATASILALVAVEEADERRFSLAVYAKDGDLKFRVPLSAPKASSDPDWFTQLVSDQQVALTEEPPRVAVGGRSRLMILDLETGAPVRKE